MAALPTKDADDLRDDLRFVAQKRHMSVVASTRRHQTTAWTRWQKYCDRYHIHCTLVGVKGAAGYLRAFTGHLRRGMFSTTGNTLRAGTVAQHISAIQKEISRLVEKKDLPDCIEVGSYELGIRELLRAFAREDPPSNRAWPVSTAILEHLLSLPTPKRWEPAKWKAAQELCVIAFFFLLRPGEFSLTTAKEDKQTIPLCRRHVFFLDTSKTKSISTCYDANTHAGLNFADQKNGKKDDKVTHGASGSTTLCPVKALKARVLDLAKHGGKANTFLYMYYNPKHKKLMPIRSGDITKALRLATADIQEETGIPKAGISARSLRPGGATALLCGKVSKDTIKLLGRWQSDAIDTYLRKQASIFNADLSATMFANGSFTFVATEHVNDPDIDRQTHILPDHLTASDVREYVRQLLHEHSDELGAD